MMWRSSNRDHMRNANVLEGYKPEEEINKYQKIQRTTTDDFLYLFLTNLDQL